MTNAHRLSAALALLLTALSACGPAPSETPVTPVTGSAATPTPTAVASDVPFAPTAWPTSGSACGSGAAPGAPGAASGGSRLGRVQALDAKTVVFTLCVSDGAFLARLAQPSMGIVDAADLARIAENPASIRDVAGRGAYRVAQWGTDNVELVRVGAASPAATEATVILRWSADAATRSADLVNSSVDGIDAPSATGLDAATTMPALAIVRRPLLATAVLGFGRGPFSDARVRRAIASGIDNGALADAFPAGSVAADHLTPCEIPAGCAGGAFRGFNAPASVAALQSLKFNFDAKLPLVIPDSPIPGLPDPAGVAAALRDQLAANMGITVQIQTAPADAFGASISNGTINGLFLDGAETGLADPSAFYAQLLLDQPKSLAYRWSGNAIKDLLGASSNPDAGARQAAYTKAATKLRDSLPVAPLVHLGGETVYRSDVKGAAASPLGGDPLGAMTAADRGQIVFEQASPPASGWCGAQPSLDAYRLCALVTDGLYGYAPGSLDPTPRLATGCTANADATVWTCRLRSAKTSSGLTLDAADVVATIRAMADPADPVHQALAEAAFSEWADLFGLTAGSAIQPVPTPTPTPTPSGTASGASPSPAASGSVAPVSAAPPPASPPSPSASPH